MSTSALSVEDATGPVKTDQYGSFHALGSEAQQAVQRQKRKKRLYILTIPIIILLVIAFVITALFVWVIDDSDDDDSSNIIPDTTPLPRVNAAGFSVEAYAKLHAPRQMQVAQVDGATIIYVSGSTPDYVESQSAIYALIDYESDLKNDKILKIFVPPQYAPTSVVIDRENNWLYITHYSVTHLCKGDAANDLNVHRQVLQLSLSNSAVAFDALLDNCAEWTTQAYYAHHGWHLTLMDPATQRLCMSFGVACNICEAEHPQATISCFNDMLQPNVANMTIYADGVRDSVGMDFHPLTGELWFTDNGRDSMGDDFPDCELNRVSRLGEHFGFPYCHSLGSGDPHLRNVGNVSLLVDPDFGYAVNGTCVGKENVYTAAVQAMGPHTAPLEMLFYSGAMFPERYRNSIFVAEHGSWDRSAKIGYRVAAVLLGDGEANSTVVGHEVFADGWLNDTTQTEFGRPVGLTMLHDGSMLISDDAAGVIYRVSYNTSDV